MLFAALGEQSAALRWLACPRRCMWESWKPGRSAFPWQSMTRVPGPALARSSADSPTATMRSPATATAPAWGRAGSRVRTRALRRRRVGRDVISFCHCESRCVGAWQSHYQLHVRLRRPLGSTILTMSGLATTVPSLPLQPGFNCRAVFIVVKTGVDCDAVPDRYTLAACHLHSAV